MTPSEPVRCAFVYSKNTPRAWNYPPYPCPHPPEWHDGKHGKHAFLPPTPKEVRER